jgi:hypothetical protein
MNAMTFFMARLSTTLRSKKRPASRSIKEAPEECAFWVYQGPVVRTVRELRGAIASMSDEQFDYHTKRDGNDFVRWVRDVLCNEGLAGSLARVRTRTGALRALDIALK